MADSHTWLQPQEQMTFTLPERRKRVFGDVSADLSGDEFGESFAALLLRRALRLGLRRVAGLEPLLPIVLTRTGTASAVGGVVPVLSFVTTSPIAPPLRPSPSGQ